LDVICYLLRSFMVLVVHSYIYVISYEIFSVLHDSTLVMTGCTRPIITLYINVKLMSRVFFHDYRHTTSPGFRASAISVVKRLL